jgi:hypothetical protein
MLGGRTALSMIASGCSMETGVENQLVDMDIGNSGRRERARRLPRTVFCGIQPAASGERRLTALERSTVRFTTFLVWLSWRKPRRSINRPPCIAIRAHAFAPIALDHPTSRCPKPRPTGSKMVSGVRYPRPYLCRVGWNYSCRSSLPLMSTWVGQGDHPGSSGTPARVKGARRCSHPVNRVVP